jgi:hypothetical protein
MVASEIVDLRNLIAGESATPLSLNKSDVSINWPIKIDIILLINVRIRYLLTCPDDAGVATALPSSLDYYLHGFGRAELTQNLLLFAEVDWSQKLLESPHILV